MKYITQRNKIESVFNKNQTDDTEVGRISTSKNTTLLGLIKRKIPTSLIKKLQTRTLDDQIFTVFRVEDYDFQDTFNGPNKERTLPELGYEYALQSTFFSVRLEKVPFDMVYSIEAVEFIEFGALQEYVQDSVTFEYEPTGKLLEGESLYNLPELASTVFREKPMFMIEEIRESSLVNLTIFGSIVIDRTYLQPWITPVETINLYNCEFMNHHTAKISLYLGRSVYFR